LLVVQSLNLTLMPAGQPHAVAARWRFKMLLAMMRK
jgi:hypothetical protein